MFAIQPWATKSTKRTLAAAFGLALLAFAAQALLVDRLVAAPIASANRILHADEQPSTRPAFVEEIAVKGPARRHVLASR